jgi:hypothetical protein
MKQLKAELWAKWRALASEQSQSGQTVAAFCRDRGIRDSQFYDWKKRIDVCLFGRHQEGEPAPVLYDPSLSPTLTLPLHGFSDACWQGEVLPERPLLASNFRSCYWTVIV